MPRCVGGSSAAVTNGGISAKRLIEEGLAHKEQLGEVRESVTGTPGPGSMRALEVRLYGGLDFRLLPDRGLDISSAWFGNVPLAWHSRVGEVPPIRPLVGADWLKGFGGGLLTTCGMQNVGAPSEGHGVHGTFSHTSAHDVYWRREVRDGCVWVDVFGTIDDVDPLGVQLRSERHISASSDVPQVTITDTVTNIGGIGAPAPWLYHLNVGAPLWSPGATVAIDSAAASPRDDASAPAANTWMRHHRAPADSPEMVVEHILDAEQPGYARVSNVSLGLSMVVRWDRTSLPRLHQWLHRAAGINALAIEPANCSVLGRAADRRDGVLPVLEPGAQRTTAIAITIEC